MLDERTIPRIFGYRLGDFCLDLGRRRLVGRNAQVIPLAGRAWDVLTYLVEARGRVVTKDELIKAVWPHTVVEDNSLAQAISMLRRALGDTRDDPRFIVTVAGRGYQFVGDTVPIAVDPSILPGQLEAGGTTDPSGPTAPEGVGAVALDFDLASLEAPQTSSAPDTTPDRSRRAWLAGLSVTMVAVAGSGWWWMTRSRSPVIRVKAIAVLPFRPLLAESGNAAIELGVTSELINRLSRLPGLVVVPLSSVGPALGRNTDPIAAGRALGVDAIVDGNVQIHDDRVRLTARLVAVGSGNSLWANSYTEPLGDLLAVQDSLASQIASALGATLAGDERTRILTHTTSDVEAWQLYASARFQVERREAGAVRRAIPLFEAALRRDPHFALAAAGLSDAHALLGVFGAEPLADTWAWARRAAKHALELDPSLPAAHVAMGHVATQYDRDLEAGRAHYAEALALDPDFAQAIAFMALNRLQAGDLDTAAGLMRKALAREPASLPFIALSAWVSYFQRTYRTAALDLARIVEAAPAAPLPRQFLAHALLAERRGVEVVRLLEGRNELAPTAYSNLGRSYAQTGNFAAAHAEIRRVEALGAQGFGVGFELALMLIELGERERALDALERGVDDHSMMQCYLNIEPALDPLREDPRFRTVSRRLGLG